MEASNCILHIHYTSIKYTKCSLFYTTWELLTYIEQQQINATLHIIPCDPKQVQLLYLTSEQWKLTIPLTIRLVQYNSTEEMSVTPKDGNFNLKKHYLLAPQKCVLSNTANLILAI